MSLTEDQRGLLRQRYDNKAANIRWDARVVGLIAIMFVIGMVSLEFNYMKLGFMVVGFIVLPLVAWRHGKRKGFIAGYETATDDIKDDALPAPQNNTP